MENFENSEIYKSYLDELIPPVWINRIVHWTHNPEVSGSKPAAGAVKILSVNIGIVAPCHSQTLRRALYFLLYFFNE